MKLRSWISTTVLLFVLLAVSATPAQAKEIVVNPNSDIVTAIKNAAAGDTIIFEDGIYYQISNLTISKSLTLKARNGGQAIISGAHPGQFTYQPDPSAPGLYTTSVPWDVKWVMVDNRVLLNYEKLNSLKSFTYPDPVAPTTPPIPGPNEGFYYDGATDLLYIRLRDQADPNLLQPQVNRADVSLGFYINNARNVTVEGFRFRHWSGQAIKIEQISQDIYIRDNFFEGISTGIDTSGYNVEHKNIFIEFNEFSNYPTYQYRRAGSYDDWRGMYNTNLNTKAVHAYTNEIYIHNNYIYEMFDGIQVFGWKRVYSLPATPSDISYNVIQNIVDNPLEFDPIEQVYANYFNLYPNLHVHHNFVLDSHSLVSMTSFQYGKIVVDHNIFYASPDYGILATWFKTSLNPQVPDPQKPVSNITLAHNTVYLRYDDDLGSRIYGAGCEVPLYENSKIQNNIILVRDASQGANLDYELEARGFQFLPENIILGRNITPNILPWAIHSDPGFTAPGPYLDFHLSAGAAAVGAGLNRDAEYFHTTLDGATDLGAIEFGAQWYMPRPGPGWGSATTLPNRPLLPAMLHPAYIGLDVFPPFTPGPPPPTPMPTTTAPVPPTPSPVPGDVIINGSFEFDSDGDGLPDEWFQQNGSPTDGRIASNLADGGYAYRITPSTSTNAYKSIAQNYWAPGQAGDVWEISLWSKQDIANPTGNLRVMINFYDSNGVLTQALNQPLIKSSSGGYQTVTISPTKPYARMKIMLQSSLTNSNALFDSVKMYRQGSLPPPPTATPQPTPTPTPTRAPPTPTPTATPTKTPVPTLPATKTSTPTPTRTQPPPTPTTPVSPGSILLNGSFEQDSDNDGIPNEWFKQNGSPTDGRIASNLADGGYVYRITPSTSTGAYKSIAQNYWLTGSAGDVWEISLWSKQDIANPAGTLRVMINFYDSNGVLTQNLSQTLSKSSSGGYQTVSISPTKPYARMKVMLQSSLTNSNALFDNVKMNKQGSLPPPPTATPTLKPPATATPRPTNTPIPPKTATPTPTKTGTPSSILLNGSFEQDSDNDGIPNEWFQQKGSPTDGRIASNLADGGYVYRITPSTSTGAYKSIAQNYWLTGSAGDVWEISLWSKQDIANPTGNLRVTINFYDSNGVLTQALSQTLSKSSSGGYQTVTISPTKSYARMKIMLQSSLTNSNALFDNVKMSKK